MALQPARPMVMSGPAVNDCVAGLKISVFLASLRACWPVLQPPTMMRPSLSLAAKPSAWGALSGSVFQLPFCQISATVTKFLSVVVPPTTTKPPLSVGNIRWSMRPFAMSGSFSYFSVAMTPCLVASARVLRRVVRSMRFTAFL